VQPEKPKETLTIELMQRRLDRERRAREQAESALEHKSLELYHANEKLQVANQSLQGQVREEATARHESEARAALIVDMALDAVVVTDDSARIIGWNGQAVRTFGWSAEEVMGKAFADLIVPADRDLVNPSRMVSEAVDKGERAAGRRMEITALHRSGRKFPAELAVSALPSQTGITFSAFVRDVTEVKEADQRRATLYQVTRVLTGSMPIETAVLDILGAICEGMGWELGCAWQVDPVQQVLRFRAEWHRAPEVTPFVTLCRQMTFARTVGLPGRIWSSGAPAWIYDVTTEENFPRRATACCAGVRTGFGFPVKVGNEIVGVMEFFRGQYRHCDTELMPLLQTLGSQIGQFMQRRNAEQEARQARAQAERARAEAEAASAAKSQFLANMSHELRTPLNAVVGMVDLLLTTNPTDRQRRFCEVARTSAHSLLQLINDILDFSKIEAGKLELQSTPFDLTELVSTVRIMLLPHAQTKGLTLTTNVEPGVPARVVGDPLRLRQVLVNLVNNAVKFTEKGGVTVDIRTPGSTAGSTAGSTVETTDSHVTLKVEVRDTGPGVAPGQISHLFKSFSQVDARMSRVIGGTGLGLAISKRFVEMMGGEIGVESQVNVGSTFWFTVRLPCANEPEKTARREDVVPDLKGLRVLVAEDNDFNQLVVRELLGHLGCKVTIASDGNEALSAAVMNDYDIILMDCQMPVMDGFEATRRIREHETKEGGHRPIIALTANAIKGDREVCLAAGMDDYVTKPIELPALARTIAALLPGASLGADEGDPRDGEEESGTTDGPLNGCSNTVNSLFR